MLTSAGWTLRTSVPLVLVDLSVASSGRPQATFAAGAPGLHRATLAFHMRAVTARARTPGSEAAGALALAARRGEFSAAALCSRAVTAVGSEPTPLRTGA